MSLSFRTTIVEWFKPNCSHFSWTNIRSYDVKGEEIIISNFVESDANFAISSTAGIVCPWLDLSLELMFVQKSVIHLLLLHSCTLRFRLKPYRQNSLKTCSSVCFCCFRVYYGKRKFTFVSTLPSGRMSSPWDISCRAYHGNRA